MPLTDLCLLRDTLHTAYNDGLVDPCETPHSPVAEQLRTADPPKDEHKRLIKAAENAFRNFGEPTAHCAPTSEAGTSARPTSSIPRGRLPVSTSCSSARRSWGGGRIRSEPLPDPK